MPGRVTNKVLAERIEGVKEQLVDVKTHLAELIEQLKLMNGRVRKNEVKLALLLGGLTLLSFLFTIGSLKIFGG